MGAEMNNNDFHSNLRKGSNMRCNRKFLLIFHQIRQRHARSLCCTYKFSLCNNIANYLRYAINACMMTKIEAIIQAFVPAPSNGTAVMIIFYCILFTSLN